MVFMTDPTLEQVLCCLYDAEIDFQVESEWDRGVFVRVGNHTSGYVAEQSFYPDDERFGRPWNEMASWLWRAACEHYPGLAEDHAAGRITWIASPAELERERVVEWLRAQGDATKPAADLLDAVEQGAHLEP
jgi:hypothetical protein